MINNGASMYIEDYIREFKEIINQYEEISDALCEDTDSPEIATVKDIDLYDWYKNKLLYLNPLLRTINLSFIPP